MTPVIRTAAAAPEPEYDREHTDQHKKPGGNGAAGLAGSLLQTK